MNPILRKEYNCTNEKCKHRGRLIFKMGGLLCEKCRRILFDNATPEYKQRIEAMRK